MGYWTMKNELAEGLTENFTEDKELTWGDDAADTFGEAVDQIIEVFKEDVGRAPTRTELVNGLLFTIQAMDELED
jgi:hypothetical protein